ncbi:pyrroloquinoline quinone-dependent dehydrogenase [Gilvimarinus sp. SDUM040013]|uniref:Pyrroloquinoline quinone-dependent dehydrogenase n=1 Tax=Gilvimarinus gilvus TaxID=3058038 RepID=A0ABU4RZP3_9GAMM|nr:pyrroloquinoline quinone-dependent dehydrogenase [Gilvimarinus sp. SDUM040013]MDO3386492.1 pyrroloquinoline quinone-dependent dehydrogenase [Gilvimarinus sp. SDUM040013]MDX6849068.1 pyrroloquinoline quinone-dependent dehydrogenase [Gilvimarinus sp. SDUM040013]
MEKRVSCGECLAILSLWVAIIAAPTHSRAAASLPDVDWPVYLGDKSSSQYSALDQINTNNVNRLEVAWIYRTGGLWSETQAQIQTNPLVIDGVLYGLTPRINVFALDATSGRKLWQFDPAQHGTLVDDESAARSLGNARGLAYWRDGDDQRLFVVIGSKLHAINATDGGLVKSFGEQGSVDLRKGLGRDASSVFVGATTPGVVYKDLLIQGTRVGEGAGAAPGHIRAYNVRTGELAWIFHTIPQPGEFGYDTWPKQAYQYAGGANSWAGMSLDEERGMVFIPTGSAAFDFWGGDRVGKNLFANSLLALNAATGERLWHFQTVHHDIWDKDLPAPPNLLQVEHHGKTIDAVAQVTKSGWLFVFDRLTGESLFPIEERLVPKSDLAGEKAWLTQPVPLKPAPFTRQTLSMKDIRDVRDSDGNSIREQVSKLTMGKPFIPFDEKGVVMFPGFDGGAEWGGAATSPDGVIYVNANEMPWVASLSMLDTEVQGGQDVYRAHCSACHGKDRQGDERSPALGGLHERYAAQDVASLVRAGRGFMPANTMLNDQQLQQLLTYLWQNEPMNWQPNSVEQKESTASHGKQVPYKFNGYHRLVDARGNPATTPPWGTLSAIDLNSGEYLWQVPLGQMPDAPLGSGAENYGGPLVTAGDLVFIAATRDEMLRAFNRHTGQLLWQTKLPAGGYATPATYRIGGEQYVVLATGGGKMGTPSFDAYIAFRLTAP